MALMVGTYHLTPNVLRLAKEVLTTPQDPAVWAEDQFKHNTYEPFSKSDSDIYPQHQEKFEAIRLRYVPWDGSERHPNFFHNFNPMTLPLWLRFALMPDLCGLNVGGVRRWRLRYIQDTPGLPSFAEYEPLSVAPELARWPKIAPQIQALFGLYVQFNQDTHGNVDVYFSQTAGERDGQFLTWVPDSALALDGEGATETADMLPYEPLPFVPTPFLQDGSGGHLMDGWVYFGDQFLDRQAGGHWLKIEDLTHFLVMGTSGFGKSVFLNQMLQGVRHNLSRFDQVLLVDLKGGVELWPYQALGAEFRVVYRFEDLAQWITALVTTIEDRLDLMRERGERNWSGKKTLLVIDEYAQIQLSPEASKEQRQAKQELLANLNKISMLGRAAGVLIWAQLQKGTSDVMDSSFRANLASQVCFKVPNKLTAAGMFGATDELMVDPVKLPKGRFILFDASKGETYYLQARVIPS